MSQVRVLESAILLGAPLLNVCRHLYNKGELDVLSYNIVTRADRYNLSAIAMLAITRLRYSDLFNIDMHSFIEGKTVLVKQNKTERCVYVSSIAEFISTYPTAIAVPDVPFPQSYSSVRYCLNKSVPRIVRNILADSYSVTHVFRHLHASFLASQDVTVLDIGKRLGHTTNDSTVHYIHDDLINHFHSFN